MSSLNNTDSALSPYHRRQEMLSGVLSASGIGALLLNPGPSLVYLTGLHFHLSERPVIAVFSPGAPIAIALPELEMQKLASLPYAVRAFPYGEEPTAWPAAFKAAIESARLQDARIGVEPTRLRYLEVSLVQPHLQGGQLVPAGHVLASLRMHKDDTEICAIRQAVQIAETALQNTLPLVRPGMSEKELAAELVLQLLRCGADAELPFAPIVSSGINSANPHAAPSDKRLLPGELLVIDWGANADGYCSDLTRTFAIGEVEAEYTRIAAIVLQANQVGRENARNGASAQAVDAAARQVIEKHGYGAFFTHRTGHGIGLEGHEDPYIRAGNDLRLAPGMTFTVEPGIYLPGRGGVRIEDNVLITPEGGETLSSLGRELQVIA